MVPASHGFKWGNTCKMLAQCLTHSKCPLSDIIGKYNYFTISADHNYCHVAACVWYFVEIDKAQC